MNTINKPLLASACLSLFALTALPSIAALSLVSAPREAKLGEQVTVTVKTQPKAQCKIEAPGEGLTQMFALRPMSADDNGKASWTFEVNRNYKANKLPLLFTSSHNGVQDKLVCSVDINSGKAHASLPVLHLVSAPSSVSREDDVTIKVHTTPGAHLKIEAQDAGLSQALALVDKTANASGNASWTFGVQKGYKAECMPIVITSDYNGAQKKLVTAIEVGRRTASRNLPKLY